MSVRKNKAGAKKGFAPFMIYKSEWKIQSKVIFIFIFYVLHFMPLTSFGQRCEILKIQSKQWNASQFGSIRFVSHTGMDLNHVDSPIVLRNHDTIVKYVFVKNYLTTPKIPNHNFIKILVGVDSYDNTLLVADRNFNYSYSDDSVYKFPVSRQFLNGKQFFDSLPTITFDSLRISPSVENKSFKFKLAPYVEGSKFLNNKTVIRNAKNFGVSFYAQNFLCTKLVIDKQDFTIAIIPHPLSFPFYWHTNLAEDGTRWSYIIFKKDKNGKNRYVNWGVFQQLLQHLKDTSHAIKIQNKYLLVNSISLDSNLISVSILDSAVYAKSQNKVSKKLTSLKNFEAFCLNDGKFLNYDFRKNKLTLVEFSGSWCVPCTEVLPQLKELYKKYSDKVEFVSLMEEKSKADAEKYFANHNLQWPVFYENISDSATVKAKMKVKIYPNFLLIDQQGEIIYQQYSSQSLDKIEAQIQRHFNRSK